MDDKIAADNSIELFNSGFGCAESVLMALTEYAGIKSELIPRIATGFCGGVAFSGGVCGAVTGAIMALNLSYGRDINEQSKEENYKMVQLFLERFRGRFGEIHCPSLTGIDLSTEEGRNRFADGNLHDHCMEFVRDATQIAQDLMK